MAEEIDEAAIMAMDLEDVEDLTQNRLSSFVSRLTQPKQFEEESDIPDQAPPPLAPTGIAGEGAAPEGMVAGTQATEGRLPETIPENVDQSVPDKRKDAARAALIWQELQRQGGIA